MSQSIFSRWAQRKQNVADESLKVASEPSLESPVITPADLESTLSPADTSDDASEPEAERLLTDRDMPALDSLEGDSNVSAFFSEGVSEKLRQKALATLFLKPEFNLRDGLEDYDDDYSNLVEMSQELADGVRHWMSDLQNQAADSIDEPSVEPTMASHSAATIEASSTPEASLTPEADVSEATPVSESLIPDLSQSDSPQGSESVSDKMPHIS